MELQIAAALVPLLGWAVHGASSPTGSPPPAVTR